MKKVIYRKSTVQIPLTGYELLLFIAVDPRATFDATAKKYFGLSESTKSFHAMATRGPAGFGLYFPARDTHVDDVAHEVRHVVNYLIDTMGHDATVSDEFGPRLEGFIAKYVHRQFKKAGLRIAI